MNRESNSTPDTMPPPSAGSSDMRQSLEDIERTEELRSSAFNVEEPGLGDTGPWVGEVPQQGEARARAGLRSFVIQRPITALVGALAAGFIVGRILSRR